MTSKQIIDYHFVAAGLVRERETANIPLYFCHLNILNTILTEEDYRNPNYFAQTKEIFRNIFNDDYRDYLTDNELSEREYSFDQYTNIILSTDREDGYGGNGCYDSYILSQNILKDMILKFLQNLYGQ